MTLTMGWRTSLRTAHRSWALHDAATGATLTFGTPQAIPDLWERYLDGAWRTYAAHGVTEALEFDAVRDGEGTALFCAAVTDDGEVIGGLRVQGPYADARESHAIREWSGQPGGDALVAAIDSRIGDGLIEAKAAYVEPSSAVAAQMAGLLARTTLILTTITGCRFMMATAADYVLKRWQSGGGRIDTAIPAAAYPDERYRTRAMFWDRHFVVQDAEPEVGRQVIADYHQVFEMPSGIIGPDHIEVA